ncbi:MAG: biotin/lipoate A/B protein ligase family protein [Sulfolobales archaeon]
MRGILRVMIAEWPENQFFNLAFEEAFYREARIPTLRLWRNDKVVIIGRFQSPALEVRAVEARKLGVKLVRRFTGGGAVYHDLGNINYALALPGYDLDIENAFKLVGEAVVEGLRDLGIDKAYFKPMNDIEVEGLKISGLAASISSDRVFVHGAMLVSSDISTLWSVLKISAEKLSDKQFTRSRVKRVTTVREVLGRDVSPNEIYDILARAIARRLNLEISWSEPDEGEIRRALELYRSRYSRFEWNLAYLRELQDLIDREELEAFEAIGRPDRDQERILERLRL